MFADESLENSVLLNQQSRFTAEFAFVMHFIIIIITEAKEIQAPHTQSHRHTSIHIHIGNPDRQQ